MSFRHLTDVDLDILGGILELCPSWQTVVHNLRYTTASLIVLLGLWLLLLAYVTRGSAERLQGVKDWTPLQHALWPYVQLKYAGVPPV